MHISSCLHPQKVYNKYTNEVLYVPCGKCAACSNIRAKRWIEKMNQESRCWKYAFSLYLDYNEDSCPRFGLVGDYLVEQNPRFFKKFTFDEICIPISDLKFDYEYERDYLFDRCTNHDGIPHASVRDIQLFKKRLNKWLFKHVTGRYQNFRSAITAELGPTTFRGHYHGILWFNDDRIASKIQEGVTACWSFNNRPLGHTTCEPPKESADAVAGYVAQYITRPTHLPSFHSDHRLSQFFLTSKNPPIGSLYESSKEVREIFFNGSCERVANVVRQGQVQICSVPLSPVFKNRLFPKCPRFDRISDFERVKLYRCLLREDGSPFEDFREAKYQLKRKLGFSYIDSAMHDAPLSNSWLTEFLFSITDGFQNDAPLLSLYRISSRIYFQSQIFGISFNEYLQHIFSFHNNYKKYQLKKFYEFQESFTYSPSELVYMYPSYVDFYNSQPLWLQERLSLYKSKEFTQYKSQAEFIYEDSHKRSKRNSYFEKLSRRDPSLTSILNRFFDAKKCYETNEAESCAWSQRLRLVSPSGKYYQLRRNCTLLKYPDRSRW